MNILYIKWFESYFWFISSAIRKFLPIFHNKQLFREDFTGKTVRLDPEADCLQSMGGLLEHTSFTWPSFEFSCLHYSVSSSWLMLPVEGNKNSRHCGSRLRVKIELEKIYEKWPSKNISFYKTFQIRKLSSLSLTPAHPLSPPPPNFQYLWLILTNRLWHIETIDSFPSK